MARDPDTCVFRGVNSFTSVQMPRPAGKVHLARRLRQALKMKFAKKAASSNILNTFARLCVVQHIAPHTRIRSKAWCIRHKKRCCIRRDRSKIAGTPCQDFSRCGKQTGFHGPNRDCTFAWMRVSQNTEVPLHENVLKFPPLFEEALNIDNQSLDAAVLLMFLDPWVYVAKHSIDNKTRIRAAVMLMFWIRVFFCILSNRCTPRSES